ncbi:MAG: hypothetical protein DLM54_10260 [Acidimicrobiales bacterium]|nr:MAG: hypothetical protein DLM54_10260 [Acidimicrobiales bacterium]
MEPYPWTGSLGTGLTCQRWWGRWRSCTPWPWSVCGRASGARSPSGPSPTLSPPSPSAPSSAGPPSPPPSRSSPAPPPCSPSS